VPFPKFLRSARSNSDKSEKAVNTVAERYASFAVLTGTDLTQELEASREESFYPTIDTEHAPVLDAAFVNFYHQSEADPPTGYRFVVRLDPKVEEQMKRQPPTITLSFDFRDHASNADELETQTQKFYFELDPEKEKLLDGYLYKQFLFVCGETDSTADIDLGEIQLFDVTDDSGLGFAEFVTVWPGRVKSTQRKTVPLAEMLPDIETRNDPTTDPTD
jgi:hypothetical protein